MKPCSYALLASLALIGCSDEGEDDEGTSTSVGATTAVSSGPGGSTTTGSSAGSGGGGGAGGGGGSGGEGGSGGGESFGPCHGYTDDFDGFDPASATDYWVAEGASPATMPDPAVSLTPPLLGNYAGLYNEMLAPAANCFASVRVEDEGGGSVFLEVLDGTGSGQKIVVEHQAGTVTALNILDAKGNGDTLGMVDVTELQGFRVQLRADQIVCEVNDGGTWTEIGVLDELPAWTAGDVDFGFGMSDLLGGTTVFDDFNLDPPM